MPAAAERLFADAATVLLIALAATSALTSGHGFAGWARPAGVLVAGVLAARRAPFPVVVLAAAGVTRAGCGVPGQASASAVGAGLEGEQLRVAAAAAMSSSWVPASVAWPSSR